jgi:hypothetical protein
MVLVINVLIAMLSNVYEDVDNHTKSEFTAIIY